MIKDVIFDINKLDVEIIVQQLNGLVLKNKNNTVFYTFSIDPFLDHGKKFISVLILLNADTEQEKIVFNETFLVRNFSFLNLIMKLSSSKKTLGLALDLDKYFHQYALFSVEKSNQSYEITSLDGLSFKFSTSEIWSPHSYFQRSGNTKHWSHARNIIQKYEIKKMQDMTLKTNSITSNEFYVYDDGVTFCSIRNLGSKYFFEAYDYMTHRIVAQTHIKEYFTEFNKALHYAKFFVPLSKKEKSNERFRNMS